MSASLRQDKVVVIGLGANLPSGHDSPLETLERALEALESPDVTVCAVSPWYESAPVPASDQPWFVNAVALIETDLAPEALLARLHKIEQAFGRVRRERWEARVLDLDLLDYRGQVRTGTAPILPHPRLGERAFVLLPLADLVPEWRHPVTGELLRDLIAKLAPGQEIRRKTGPDTP